MAFTPIPDAWRVTLQGDIEGVAAWAMVFCVGDDHTHDVARAGSIEGTFEDWWLNDLSPSVHQSVSLNLIRVLDLESETGIAVNFPISPPVNGDVTSAAAGSQVAIMVTLNSAGRGRANRGRKFVPGVPAADIDAAGGTALEASPQAGFTTIFESLRTAIPGDSSDAFLAIESKSTGTAVEVVSCQARLHLGGQRRRRNNAI